MVSCYIVWFHGVWYGWHGGDHMGTISRIADQQNGLPSLIEFHGSQENGIYFAHDLNTKTPVAELLRPINFIEQNYV